VTGHTLECGWWCPGCGDRVPAGETVHQWGEAWRCAACLPAPEATPWRARTLPPNPPERRYAKGTTLEELLGER